MKLKTVFYLKSIVGTSLTNYLNSVQCFVSIIYKTLCITVCPNRLKKGKEIMKAMMWRAICYYLLELHFDGSLSFSKSTELRTFHKVCSFFLLVHQCI